MDIVQSSKKLPRNWIILAVGVVFALSIPIAIVVQEVDVSTFFGLFIPASLGVIGSYGLYRQRQKDRRRSLRQALTSEIEGMPLLQRWPPEDDSGIPSIDVLSITVFESNSMDLGLLSEDEQKVILGFYAMAGTVQEALQFHGKFVVESGTSLAASEAGSQRRNREKEIMKIIDNLAIRRHIALYTVDQKTATNSSFQRLHDGEIITSAHPVVKRSPGILVRYNLLNEVEGDTERYRVTAKGEAIFTREQNVDDLELKEYQLGGFEEKVETAGKSLMQIIKELTRKILEN